jgi:AraC-like DNA-binding protein
MRKHPIADAMAAMLECDPSLTGKEMSARLGLSVSRLARVFKAERGMSIVEYRHRLRFARFFALVTREGNRPQTLAQAAQIAGFGSYPHFHRLFCARWHKRPREMVRDGTSVAILPELALPQAGELGQPRSEGPGKSYDRKPRGARRD